MPNVASNSNVPDHSFNPQLSVCAGCHMPAPTKFNMGGWRDGHQERDDRPPTGFERQGWLTRATAPPYTPLTDPDGGAGQVGDGNWADDNPLPGVTLTAAQAGALYNYLIISRGGAYGVHDPLYKGQLLYDSYEAVTGGAPPTYSAGRP